MAVSWIRLRQVASQLDTVQFVRLDGARIGIRARYSAYDERWSIWILDGGGAALVGPIRVEPGIDLLRPYKHIAGVPQGELFAQGRTREPPDLDTIDDGVRLLYRDA